MSQIDYRKVVKVGDKSFAVILPRGWVRFNELENKGKVEVISNSDITIKPFKKGKIYE